MIQYLVARGQQQQQITNAIIIIAKIVITDVVAGILAWDGWYVSCIKSVQVGVGTSDK